jgi:hypothetical protein
MVTITSFINSILSMFFILAYIPTLHLYSHYERLRVEVLQFSDSYTDSPVSWISSLVVSVTALTVGPAPGPIYDIMLVSIFFLPAAVFFSRYRPFTVSCKYIGAGVDHSSEGVPTATVDKSNGSNIPLKIRVAKKQEKYRLKIKHPDELILDDISTPPKGEHNLSGNSIEGDALETRPAFRLGLMFTIEGGTRGKVDQKVILIKDNKTGRVLQELEVIIS